MERKVLTRKELARQASDLPPTCHHLCANYGKQEIIDGLCRQDNIKSGLYIHKPGVNQCEYCSQSHSFKKLCWAPLE